MRLSNISARFGHQLATFVFLRLVFAEDIKNSFVFVKIASFRRYWSRLLLSWRRGMRLSNISARFGHQLATFVFLRLVFAEDIKNSFFFVKIASFRRYWSRLLLSWRRGMRLSNISARFGHQLATFVFLRLVFAEDIKNSFFFVKIASFRRYWSRLLLSWRRGMRLSNISARFGHQLATFVFLRLVFAEDIKNSFVFVKIASFRRYWSRLLLSWRRGMRLSNISARFGHQLATFVFLRLVFAEDIKNSFFFVKIASFRRYWSRLLLSWRRGMRLPNISARFGHQLATFVFLRLVFAEDIKNSFFFIKIASFRRHWFRLLLSWGRGMRFSTISARFGHQFATFSFFNARLCRIYQKQQRRRYLLSKRKTYRSLHLLLLLFKWLYRRLRRL